MNLKLTISILATNERLSLIVIYFLYKNNAKENNHQFINIHFFYERQKKDFINKKNIIFWAPP